ncbi:MAG: hypothetical protein FD125_2971, partial [bacterium]
EGGHGDGGSLGAGPFWPGRGAESTGSKRRAGETGRQGSQLIRRPLLKALPEVAPASNTTHCM